MADNHKSSDPNEVGFSPTLSEISVLIVEDHPVVAFGLKGYLETAVGIKVVAIHNRGEDVMESVQSLAPDVVLMDLVLDGSQIDGVEATRRIRKVNPNMKVLVVSAYSDERRVLAAIEAGVDGYLIKTARSADIIEAVRVVASGQTIFHPKVTKIMRLYVGGQTDGTSSDPVERSSIAQQLTDREWDVLKLVVQEKSNAEIGRILVISPKTAKTHVSNLLKKLGVRDRKQARVWYHLYLQGE